MKAIRLAALCGAAFLAVSTSAHAQTRFGIGVGLGSTSFGGGDADIFESALSPTSIYFPITMNRVRFEPEFGLLRLSTSSGNVSVSATMLQIGTGIFGISPATDNLRVYYGGRIGITRLSSDAGSFGGNSSSTNLFLGPALGGEHMFGQKFSLGGEAQLLYTNIGNDSESDEDVSSSLMRTRALFFIRWHF